MEVWDERWSSEKYSRNCQLTNASKCSRFKNEHCCSKKSDFFFNIFFDFLENFDRNRVEVFFFFKKVTERNWTEREKCDFIRKKPPLIFFWLFCEPWWFSYESVHLRGDVRRSSDKRSGDCSQEKKKKWNGVVTKKSAGADLSN